MTENNSPDESETTRGEPVGAPVVRGDPEITGARSKEAITFDPDDPESIEEAIAIVREFAKEERKVSDSLDMLRGAAACAALVRGEGSYKAAAERAGDPVTVSFLRKWSRVHDLPISIRRHIAMGAIAPTAAMHIARVTGDARFILAWAVLDNDLTVDQVRMIASKVGDGRPIGEVLGEYDVTPGEVTVVLPLDLYRQLHRIACLGYGSPDNLLADAFEQWLKENP